MISIFWCIIDIKTDIHKSYIQNSFLSTKIRLSSFFINSRNMALILRIWENFSSSGWAGGELALC